jgi:excisionase family DNA binding protein
VFLNVHPNTVRSQVRRGELPGAKIGGGWRFLEADLLAWVRLRYPARSPAAPGADEGNRQWSPGGTQDLMLTGSRGMTERALDALLERPGRSGRRTVPRE